MALAAPTPLSGHRRRGGGRWRGGRGRGSCRGRRGQNSASTVELVWRRQTRADFELVHSEEEDGSLYDGSEDSPLDCGGYDFDFVGDVPAALQCLICTLPAREAQQVDCCGKIFCQSCLVILKKSKNSGCPNCRSRTIKSFADKRSDRDVQSLTVRCSNLGSSCSWKGELRNLVKHMQQCLQPCKYAPMGCLVRLMKENLVLHEEKCIVERLKGAMEKIQALEKQIKPLLMQRQAATRVMMSSGHCAPVTFQFKKLMEVKSVTFYSHSSGYKFLLSFKCTLMPCLTASVRVHIMHGEYDDSLEWPFRGVINFEMLNQEEDWGHKQGSAKFKERKVTMKNRRVPPGQEKNDEGWGGKLAIDSGHYIKDDSLYIRVMEVVVEGLNKPWLSDRLVVVNT